MKLRFAFAAMVYAVALAVGALVVTGHFMSSTFSPEPQQVATLENDNNGSMVLLCDGCYGNKGTTVTITITVGVNGGYNNCCYQPQVYYPQQVYYQPQPIYYQPQPILYNPCNWGCGGQYYGGWNNWNNNNWGGWNKWNHGNDWNGGWNGNSNWNRRGGHWNDD